MLQIDDAAVIVKDAEGKVHVQNQVSRGTWSATGVGGLLGLLIGSIFFPIGGLVLGLAGGALVGRMMNLGVDGKFVKQVEEEIQTRHVGPFRAGRQRGPDSRIGDPAPVQGQGPPDQLVLRG